MLSSNERELPICLITLYLPLEERNKYICIPNGFWSEVNKSQFLTNTYIDLFVLNKCKHMKNAAGVKKTILCYCCIQHILRDKHSGIKNRVREEFEKDDILFGLKLGENLINDVDIIHIPIHITAAGGHFCLFSVVMADIVVVISDSYFVKIRPEHKDVLNMLICYLEMYEMKMCGLTHSWK